MSNNGYILNVKTGVLHTHDCGSGKTGLPGVKPGDQKHYGNANNARRDPAYKRDHSVCME